MLKNKTRIFLKLIIILIIWSIDQTTKYLIRKYIILGESIPLINSFLYLTHIENTGIAFGFLKNNNLLLVFIVTGIIITLFLFEKDIIKQCGNTAIIPITIVLGGAVGNLTDRILRGGITDFIEIGVSGYYFPSFNFADSCITVGGVFLALILFLNKKNNKKI